MQKNDILKIRSFFLGLVKSCLILLSLNLYTMAAKVDTVNIYSKGMNKKVPAVVILPESYKSSKNLPVIYLLHGYSDNYLKWITTVPSIKDLADRYKVIIVCPDGGFDSWYLDSPLLKEHKYETFISTELIDWIDKNYKTNSSKNGRAITGLSM